MGRRGPKPTPTKTLEARGSWLAKARKKAGEPEYQPIEPKMPNGLGDAGVAEWLRIVPQLAAKRILADVDTTNLWLMCKALDEHEQADAAVKEHGLLVAGANGGWVLNPAVHERQRAWGRYVKLSAAFGMTAGDRSRVSTGEKDDKGTNGNISKFFAPRRA